MDLMVKKIKEIEMPAEMQERILENVMKPETEKIKMNKRKESNFFKKMATIAATLVLCAGLTGITALAATGKLQGIFKDVKNWNGAIIGSVYEQATDEITVSIEDATEGISVLITMVNPEKPPYISFEEFGIASYKIEDMSGEVVNSDSSTSMIPIDNGQVTVKIPLDNISSGNYKLIIDTFVGGSKADQPLEISGEWEVIFHY